VSGRRRVLFTGSARYDLPLAPEVARKWDALSERLDVRVIGRRGRVEAEDPRFATIDAAGGPGFYARLPLAVRREARAFRPDVIVAQSPYEGATLLPVLPLLRPRPRLIVEVHGDWRTASRLYGSRARGAIAPLSDLAARTALRRADAHRALTAHTAELIEDATGRRPVGTFPTYFDLGSFEADPPRPVPERPAVAWVAVLERYKNPDGFVAAWRRVARELPEARLTMVGDGPLRPVVDELARELPETVTLVPRMTPAEIARLLDDSTLLVLPSRMEGMGRVIIEAFARARPVVASAVGGIPDLVDHDRNGLLVPPEDEERLAAELLRVLRDRGLAERLGGAAHEDAKRLRWTPERFAEANVAMVEAALGASGATPARS
jgi:glycosyltransferase involved in cell wall biosynthesis